MNVNQKELTIVETANSSTKDLRRVLGFWDLMSQAVGQIIGAGIMSLTGVAIAMTGRSVPVSFILSAVLVLISSIPMILINATARFRGGQYSIVGSLFSKKYSGAYMIMFILTNVSIAMYALSFADYAMPFIPFLPRKLLALGILTLLYGLNLVGVDVMAKFQNAIVLILVVALAAFSAFGITQLQPNYFSDSFITNGLLGLFRAGALLTFATGGALAAANLAGEAKNPTRDIPLVIIISTVAVAVLYGFMSVIAAGVLPVAQVAGQPLTWVAETILPRWLYVFFVVGGAWFALISTLNSQLGWATKPVMQACEDGWFPRGLAHLHPKFKTPVYLLTIMYVLGFLPIVFDLDISIIGSITIIVYSLNNVLLCASLLGVNKIMPALWNKSKFKVSDGMIKFIVVISIVINLLQFVLLASDLTTPLLIGNIAVIAFAFLYSIGRYSTGKVEILESYEEN